MADELRLLIGWSQVEWDPMHLSADQIDRPIPHWIRDLDSVTFSLVLKQVVKKVSIKLIAFGMHCIFWKLLCLMCFLLSESYSIFMNQIFSMYYLQTCSSFSMYFFYSISKFLILFQRSYQKWVNLALFDQSYKFVHIFSCS